MTYIVGLQAITAIKRSSTPTNGYLIRNFCFKTVWSVTLTTLCTSSASQLRTLPDLAILCTPKDPKQRMSLNEYEYIYLTVCHDVFLDFQYRHSKPKTLYRSPALILQSIALSLRAKRSGYWKLSQEGFFFPPLSDENEFGILLLEEWLMIAIRTVNSLVTLKIPCRGRCRPGDLARPIDVVRKSEPLRHMVAILNTAVVTHRSM